MENIVNLFYIFKRKFQLIDKRVDYLCDSECTDELTINLLNRPYYCNTPGFKKYFITNSVSRCRGAILR